MMEGAATREPLTMMLAVLTAARPAMRALRWGLGLLLLLWPALTLGPATGVDNDFTENVWLPARLLLDGVDPYAPPPPAVDAALGPHRAAFPLFNGGPRYYFIYPLWVAVAMLPLGALPLETATALWRAANALLLIWAAGALMRAANPALRRPTLAAVAALAVGTLLVLTFRPSLLTLHIGQFSIIELGLLTAVWGWLLRSGSRVPDQVRWGDLLAGAALAVLLTKPQAVGLPVLLLLLWSLTRRRWAIPAATVGALAALLLLPLALRPASLGDWLATIFGGRGQAISQAPASASVWGLSAAAFGEQGAWPVVAALACLPLLALLLPRWRADLLRPAAPAPLSLPLTIGVNSLVSPYLLGYEHVLLLLPALLLLASAGAPEQPPGTLGAGARRWLRLGLYAWLILLPLLVITAQALLQNEYPHVAQSATLLALSWAVPLAWHDDRLLPATRHGAG